MADVVMWRFWRNRDAATTDSHFLKRMLKPLDDRFAGLQRDSVERELALLSSLSKIEQVVASLQAEKSRQTLLSIADTAVRYLDQRLDQIRRDDEQREKELVRSLRRRQSVTRLVRSLDKLAQEDEYLQVLIEPFSSAMSTTVNGEDDHIEDRLEEVVKTIADVSRKRTADTNERLAKAIEALKRVETRLERPAQMASPESTRSKILAELTKDALSQSRDLMRKGNLDGSIAMSGAALRLLETFEEVSCRDRQHRARVDTTRATILAQLEGALLEDTRSPVRQLGEHLKELASKAPDLELLESCKRIVEDSYQLRGRITALEGDRDSALSGRRELIGTAIGELKQKLDLHARNESSLKGYDLRIPKYWRNELTSALEELADRSQQCATLEETVRIEGEISMLRRCLGLYEQMFERYDIRRALKST